MNPRSAGSQFNHDLLRHADMRAQMDWHRLARQKFPHATTAVIDEALICAFAPFEDAARRWKKCVRMIGTFAVALMTIVLACAIAGVYGVARHERVLSEAWEELIGAAALVSLTLAFLVCRVGPLRKAWLKKRFCAEVLRLWHFRDFLSSDFICAITEESDRAQDALRNRQNRLRALLDSFENDAWARLVRLVNNGADPIPQSAILQSQGVAPASSRVDEAYQAYGELRIEHQANFFAKRTNGDFPDFVWLDSHVWSHLVGASVLLSLGGGLGASIVFAVAGPSLTWLSILITALTVLGVSVRSWGDGMKFQEEQEHYALLGSVFEGLRERWQRARSTRERLIIVSDVERAALGDLRGFLRIHLAAQFIV